MLGWIQAAMQQNTILEVMQLIDISENLFGGNDQICPYLCVAHFDIINK